MLGARDSNHDSRAQSPLSCCTARRRAEAATEQTARTVTARTTNSPPTVRTYGSFFRTAGNVRRSQLFAAPSVISSARSMIANDSRSCCSVMQSGGFVNRLFQLMKAYIPS